jgi:site-specific DNA-methyltransferase (adenine-specific)
MTNNKNLKEFLIEIEKVWFNFHNFLIWEKKQCNTNRWYLRNTEYILFFKKWKCKTINNPSTFPILRYEKETFISNHPNKKPYELIETLILNSSNEWDLVLDPFMWSWVAWVVCKNNNREFIWIDLDEEYFNEIKEKLESPK